MKKFLMLSAASVLSSLVLAQSADFSAIDADANGVLSFDEAKAALPEVAFSDSDSNGVLSEAEAEDAIIGLILPVENEGDDNETVDADDFALLVAALAPAQ